MEELSEEDLNTKISALQERLVCFYSIFSDIECEEARSVLQIQINNYRSSIELIENELNKRHRAF